MSAKPSIAIGTVIWFLYTAVVIGMQWRTGIPYTEWFKNAASAWQTAVIPLFCGSVLMLAFLLGTRWNNVWQDPQKLVASRVMKVAMLMWWIAIAVRLTGIDWARVPHDLLLSIVLTGILVGFAEEILFRGVFLRGMREGGRPESVAAMWTAACFGLFHLPNMFMGVGLLGLAQVVLAALSGVILYAFRRHYGMIWPAMVAHGAWDISLFLAGRYGASWLAAPAAIMQLVVVVLGIAVLISIYRNDRQLIAI